ncbi:MAG: PDZ domain-containing protein [Chitinophagaceae bacterium]|nr:MAG: PDZ domain-containing protein [Chitinophagaceae bacterium]
MNLKINLLALSCLLLQICFGQATQHTKDENTLFQFQEKLQAAIHKALSASVLITTHERLTPTGGVTASGVCVSADGIIMTAGHLTVPNGKYEVTFPDGKKLNALGLGKIGMLDVGLLKITEKGVFPFAEKGFSSGLAIGETCFSIAYPGSFSSKKVVRLGQVKNVYDSPDGDIRTRNIQTTCLMEPGDSGGPVFDLDGRVIGIRSFIGMALDENYDVPVDAYRKYWDILLSGENFNGIPKHNPKLLVEKRNAVLWNDWSKLLSTQSIKNSKFVVEISSEVDDKSNKVLGTVVNISAFLSKKNDKKYTYIISKNSEIGKNAKLKMGDKWIDLKPIYSDVEKDLVLLKAIGKLDDVNAISIDPKSRVVNNIGSILLSSMPHKQAVLGVSSAEKISLPSVFNKGYLGVRLESQNGKNLITQVQPNSAASQVGLNIGDEILAFDFVPIDAPETFIQSLKTKKVNDLITLVRQNNEKKDTLSIKLLAKPAPIKTHIAEKFTDGKSSRRDDFKSVFIQDATIKPSECGGPVFDLFGMLQGINIARYSRVSSLVMPIEEIVDFIGTFSKLK